MGGGVGLEQARDTCSTNHTPSSCQRWFLTLGTNSYVFVITFDIPAMDPIL